MSISSLKMAVRNALKAFPLRVVTRQRLLLADMEISHLRVELGAAKAVARMDELAARQARQEADELLVRSLALRVERRQKKKTARQTTNA